MNLLSIRVHTPCPLVKYITEFIMLFQKPVRKSSHARALLDAKLSAAVAGRLNCFVSVCVGANQKILIYISVKTLTTNYCVIRSG